ncbi:MAG: hypothetical protein QOE03_1610 [Micromonosporaceae bacterium]|nr:hypothetical protein [Micromonosporaceae bacterium]
MVFRRIVTMVVFSLALAFVAPVAASAKGSTQTARPPARFCGWHVPSRITLTEADNGKQVCVARHGTVMIRLRVAGATGTGPGQRWSPITASGPSLREQPQPLIAVRGVTTARYRAVTQGRTWLSSSRPLCRPSHGRPFCHSLAGWHATVIVR